MQPKKAACHAQTILRLCTHSDRHKVVITTIVYQCRHQRTTCYCCLILGVLAAQPDCEEWARNGECEKSPRYMFWGCRMSCGRCFPPTLQVRQIPFFKGPAYSLRPSASSAKAVLGVCYHERGSVAQRCCWTLAKGAHAWLQQRL